MLTQDNKSPKKSAKQWALDVVRAVLVVALFLLLLQLNVDPLWSAVLMFVFVLALLGWPFHKGSK